MQDLLKHYLDLIYKLPDWLQLISIPCIIIGIILFKSEKARDYVLLKIKTLYIFISRKNIKTHDIFIKYKHYLKSVERISFNEKNKDFIFKTLLTLKLNIVVSKLKAFISSTNIRYISKYELYDLILNLVFDMIHEYENIFKEEMIKKYGEKKGNIINDYTILIFNNFHKVNMIILEKRLLAITTSEFEFLKTNNQRLSYAIYEIHLALRSCILDAELAFNSINGTLKKIVENE